MWISLKIFFSFMCKDYKCESHGNLFHQYEYSCFSDVNSFWLLAHGNFVKSVFRLGMRRHTKIIHEVNKDFKCESCGKYFSHLHQVCLKQIHRDGQNKSFQPSWTVIFFITSVTTKASQLFIRYLQLIKSCHNPHKSIVVDKSIIAKPFIKDAKI